MKIELDGMWYNNVLEELRQKYDLTFEDITEEVIRQVEKENREYWGPQVMRIIGRKEEIVRYLLNDYGIEEDDLEMFVKEIVDC